MTQTRLNAITTKRETKPPIVGLFGKSGVGKTTFASEFPHPIIVRAEDGLVEGLDVPAFDLRETWQEIRQDLFALITEKHKFHTAILDSTTGLEPLIWDQVCEDKSWESIESPGYGKGYIECDLYWRRLMKAASLLRDAGMIVVLIAHEETRTVNDPTTEQYDHFQMRLHKRAEPIIRDNCDILGHLAQRVMTVGKKNEPKRAVTDETRVLRLAPNPAWTAKCRYPGAPSEVEIPLGQGYAALLDAVPSVKSLKAAKSPAKRTRKPKAKAPEDAAAAPEGDAPKTDSKET